MNRRGFFKRAAGLAAGTVASVLLPAAVAAHPQDLWRGLVGYWPMGTADVRCYRWEPTGEQRGPLEMHRKVFIGEVSHWRMTYADCPD